MEEILKICQQIEWLEKEYPALLVKVEFHSHSIEVKFFNAGTMKRRAHEFWIAELDGMIKGEYFDNVIHKYVKEFKADCLKAMEAQKNEADS